MVLNQNTGKIFTEAYSRWRTVDESQDIHVYNKLFGTTEISENKTNKIIFFNLKVWNWDKLLKIF